MGSRVPAKTGLFSALLLAFAPAQAAQTIYCCEAGGRPVCSDILPPACYGQAYREVGPQGTILKRVQAPPTAEEIARRRAEAERRKDEEARETKARRLDQALLETYQSVGDLDRRRDRALADIDRTIADLRAREEDLIVRRHRMLPGADGKSGPPANREQAEALRDLDGELAAHRSVIEAKLREREGVRLRYDEDRVRYLELTAPGKPVLR